MSGIDATRFHRSDGGRILDPIEEDPEMITGHSLQIPVVLHTLDAVALACRHAVDSIRAAWVERRARRTLSRLPLHLRYDIGELDVRRAPPAIGETDPRSEQIELETLWRRYGC